MNEPFNAEAQNKTMDELLKIVAAVKHGNQVEGLWRCFNVLVDFTKSQTESLQAMHRFVTAVHRQVNEMQEDLQKVKVEVQRQKQTTQAQGRVM